MAQLKMYRLAGMPFKDYDLPEGYSISKYKMYDIYQGHKETFYCKATFDNKRNIFLPKGMSVPNQYKNRYL